MTAIAFWERWDRFWHTNATPEQLARAKRYVPFVVISLLFGPFGLLFLLCLLLPKLTHTRPVIFLRDNIAPNWFAWLLGTSLACWLVPVFLGMPAFVALLGLRYRRPRIRVPARSTP